MPVRGANEWGVLVEAFELFSTADACNAIQEFPQEQYGVGRHFDGVSRGWRRTTNLTVTFSACSAGLCMVDWIDLNRFQPARELRSLPRASR